MAESSRDVVLTSRSTGERKLPVDLTSFEGRKSDLNHVKHLMGETRLLTLTGFGGVGKTRLALRAARELARSQADGVAWVELADLRDPALLQQTVVDALNMPELPARDTWAAALQHLARRHMLLVLDNCEHVLHDVAAMVDELLRHAPGLRILATSRQILGVPGETVLCVAPLPVPPAERASEPGVASLFPSLALFRERAAAVVPGFELTPANQDVAVELCRKLEGIPLAIELAAVKLRVLGLDDLLARLDARLSVLAHPARTGPSRHRTIEATIDWSYDLCTEDERTLWARASVFAGGFTVDAAEEVCAGGSLPREAVLDVVQGLVEKSVLLRSENEGQVRFRMLEPIREHGQARLRDAGEQEELVHRHLAWMENLLEEACLQWFGPTQHIWCTRLRLEQPNFRAAAEHCIAHQECRPRALALVGQPWFLWIALFLDEGRQWLERSIAASPEPSLPRAVALGTLSYVASLQGDRDRADEAAVGAHAWALESNDERVQAYATHMAGLAALFTDDLSLSQRLLATGLALYQGHDVLDDHIVALRIQLGLAHLFRGELDEARAHFQWCRELCELTGERWLLSYALYGLGFVEKLEGHPEDALALARKALEIKWFYRDLCGLSTTMELIAWAHADAHRYQEAACLLGAADNLWLSFGVRLFGSAHWLENGHRAERESRQASGDRVFDAAYESGKALDRFAAIALALGHQAALSPAQLAEASGVRLTRREEQIAGLIADGLSNRAIAERLVISQRTAEGHVERILTKLDFHSRAQIAAWVGERRTAAV
ncbi:MAG TPA: LuxR C-terminal-related transcriptional regulator [Nocardioides sp.]|nr:LuxR C-terminal-related transcriptional regulator [Nocardioides sp.]